MELCLIFPFLSNWFRKMTVRRSLRIHLIDFTVVEMRHPLMLMPPVCCCLSAAACLLQFDKFDKVSFISVNKRCFIEENVDFYLTLSFPLSVAFVGNFLPDWGSMPCK
ncbi:hypothetical protein T4A_7314 [Trichinella pseudospiralis]|uniref:Uncharacterized protein n=1 Tax=Trichinella pseudospiralis TaxID=6337 RepID=A0A0V1DVJ1_TRIPS|nr:hypothetical protein T4A_7314 [Trichinella pseudospiralis]